MQIFIIWILHAQLSNFKQVSIHFKNLAHGANSIFNCFFVLTGGDLSRIVLIQMALKFSTNQVKSRQLKTNKQSELIEEL